jgi:predicted phage terminase large subunit-like protein
MVDLDKINQELSRRDLFEFSCYTFPKIREDSNWFHEKYYGLLQSFYEGKIPRLIVSVPPQHGKSEGSSRRGIGWCLGQFPHKKIALVSYNHPFAAKFNRDVQRIIDDSKYRSIFPNTNINGKNVVTSSSWLRNSEEFEIVNNTGGLKTIGVGGGLTGNTVDLLVMDDLYKDYADATSPTISERVWEWYTTVAKTRLHNNSQELIVFTRWSENDLVGRLEEQGLVHTLKEGEDPLEVANNMPKDYFLKINFEALKESEPNELDPREYGAALWETKHNAEKLNATRKLDVPKFEALYQGNPKAKEGLLYSEFKTYSELPKAQHKIESYTDYADTGSDNLCSIAYAVFGNYAYILDIVYTKKKTEYSEPLVVEMHKNNNVAKAYIESNSGGRQFTKNVERLSRQEGNHFTKFVGFHQSKNKISRILSNSVNVTNQIIMPEGWEIDHKRFYKDVVEFLAKGRNPNDDAPDTLTGIIEKISSSKRARLRKI